MPKLKAVEPKNIDRKSSISMLESALQKAKDGELIEFVIVGKHRDGTTYLCASGSYNAHEMAGKILDAAIMRLGYALRRSEDICDG